MGALASRALRPLKTFNIENRAHREIGREKPQPAPQYPSTFQDLQRALEADPNLVEKLSKKDTILNQRLKDVFVTSTGASEDVFLKRRQDPKRPLPQDRNVIPDFEYGLKESDNIPYGKTTLRHVLRFLADHQANPEEFTVAKIAVDYKMKEENVASIVKYFRTFEMYVPANKHHPAQLSGPAQVRRQREASLKELGQDSKKVDSLQNVKKIESSKDAL